MEHSNYLEVKNYIHNELGITKGWIQNIIQDTVKNEIGRLINDSSYLENLILYAVKDQVRLAFRKDNELGTVHKSLQDMNQLISDSVDKAIYEEVKKKLYIGLKCDQ